MPHIDFRLYNVAFLKELFRSWTEFLDSLSERCPKFAGFDASSWSYIFFHDRDQIFVNLQTCYIHHFCKIAEVSRPRGKPVNKCSVTSKSYFAAAATARIT
jgi:hypothetical protein